MFYDSDTNVVVLLPELAAQLAQVVPRRFQNRPWRLAFSLDLQGIG